MVYAIFKFVDTSAWRWRRSLEFGGAAVQVNQGSGLSVKLDQDFIRDKSVQPRIYTYR